jgi:hypothetical protein
MKRMKITSLAILMLAISMNLFAQQTPDEQLIVPLSNPGKPYTLKVNLVMGSIDVISYDGKDIIINVSSDNDGENQSLTTREGMKRISTSGSYEVTARELDNVVTIHSDNPMKAVNLDLKIPQDVKLELGTVNEGHIIVSNVKGELEIKNVNDIIVLNNISGSVVANTVNGDVTVTFDRVDPNAAMAFSTLNGDVSVTFPPDTRANLKLKSDFGDVYSDFEVDIDKTTPKIDKTEKSGMYRIKKDDWVYGKINGGGPEIMMKNMQGDIYVKKATE